MAKIPEIATGLLEGDPNAEAALGQAKKDIVKGMNKFGKVIYQDKPYDLKNPIGIALADAAAELESLGRNNVANLAAISIGETYGYKNIKIDAGGVKLDAAGITKTFQANGKKKATSYVGDFTKGVLATASKEEKAILDESVKLGGMYGDLVTKGAVPGQVKFSELLKTYGNLNKADARYTGTVLGVVQSNANQLVELRKASVNAKYGLK